MADTRSTPLDPELVLAGSSLRERGLGAPPLNNAPIEEARAGYDAIGAHLCGLPGAPAGGTVAAISIEGADGPIECVLVSAASQSAPMPALVYFHGGGFALGRARDWVRFALDISQAAGVRVVLVDYSLAPEHPFPRAFDEAAAVMTHIRRHGGDMGIDAGRLSLGGDSAGANIALAAAASLAGEGAKALRALLLFYGVYRRDISSPEWQELGRYGLSPELMDWIWTNYAGAHGAGDWRAEPYHADMTHLPPVYQVVGDLDPLIDDARQLKVKLDAHSIANKLAVEPGLNHGFVRLGPLSPRIAEIVREAGQWLGEQLRLP